MEMLQKILLKKQQEGHGDRENQKQIPKKKKKRSQSLQTIFGLPKSVLDKLRTPDAHLLKRERSSNQKAPPIIELGELGLQYHSNLRKTIINHTKEVFNPKHPKSSRNQNNYMIKDEALNFKSKSKQLNTTSFENNAKTLSLLQKTIFKEEDLFKVNNNMFELQASRLPIIKKREPKRHRIVSALGDQYFISPPNISRQRDHPRQEWSEEYESREHRQQRQHRQLRDRQTRTIMQIVRKQKPKQEKTQIRGWDIPQYVQF